MLPDSMDIGKNLSDARQLFEHHNEMFTKLKEKKPQMTESVLRFENANDLSLLWEETDIQLDSREKLLLQSIKFYQIATQFAQKMNAAFELFNVLIETEVSDYETGYAMIDKHKKINKEILDSSIVTFDEGKELLGRIKEMSIYSHSEEATTLVGASIETLLNKLNDQRDQLEDHWSERRIKLEQCIQICFLRSEINKTMNWLMTEGQEYIENCKLGLNVTEAMHMQHLHNEFVGKNYKVSFKVNRFYAILRHKW